MITFPEILAELAERAVEDGLAHIPHELQQEVQVVDADQAVCQEFFGLEEMADIGARIVAARITLTTFFNGMEIVGILGVAHGQAARMGHGHAVAGNARREDAVKHIDAAGDAFEQAVRRADAHEVTGFILRQIRCRML